MRVLISGGGIAGFTVAYWLRRYGFTPAIVERAPSLLTGGYKIDVRGTALQVLRRMGIHDAVVAASTDMQDAFLVDKNEKNQKRLAFASDVFKTIPGFLTGVLTTAFNSAFK